MIFSGTGGSAKKASLASVLSLGANGTISIWATFVAAGAGPVPSKSVFIYDGARAVLSLDRASNNKIYFNPGGTEVATGTLSPAIIANGTTWYNIVVSRAGTIADIYVNNVKYSITGLGTNALTLQTIGAGFASGATANEFNGTIDEVVVWDRQLSTTEVNTLYTSRGTGW
jgi:hypothetical protein